MYQYICKHIHVEKFKCERHFTCPTLVEVTGSTVKWDCDISLLYL